METELKLLLAPNDVAAFRRLPLLDRLAAGPPVSRRQVDSYFDTADRRLHAQGLLLRVRRQGRTTLQTLKIDAPAQAGLHRRHEWEGRIVGPRPDLDRLLPLLAGAGGEVTAARVLEMGEAGLSGCGLSKRKIEYLCDLAGHFAGGKLVPATWSDLDDEAVIGELTAVRGIGRWTAEMFLIFNQMRPDVFPLDDIGLQRAVFERYFAGEKQSRRTLAEFGERWRPWRSVATWYLWRSLDPLPVEY